MKKCFKCGKMKLLDEFYRHPAMGDGHLGKCKDCAKKDVKKRTTKLLKNPLFKEHERKRAREKYYRLYRYRKRDSRKMAVAMNKYKKKYPEKILAKCRSNNIVSPVGFEKHHWSYNPEHYKDLFFLNRQDHARLHRYMVYDPKRMMYRTCADSVLLDTREKHAKYIGLTQTWE